MVSINKKYFIPIVIILIVLSGCASDLKDEDVPVEQEGANEHVVSVPPEVAAKGYNYFYESKENQSGSYAYEVYTDKGGPCSAGYLGSNVPVHCLMRIIDLESGDVIGEFESDEYAVFPDIGVAPSDWYDDESLFVVSGFGDACIGWETAKAYNIITEDSIQLYESSVECTPGDLYKIGGKELLFHFVGGMYSEDETADKKLEVYEVISSIEGIDDLYITNEENPFAKVLDKTKVKKIQSLDGGKGVDYELGFGILVYAGEGGLADDDYIYDVEGNEFIPYVE